MPAAASFRPTASIYVSTCRGLQIISFSISIGSRVTSISDLYLQECIAAMHKLRPSLNWPLGNALDLHTCRMTPTLHSMLQRACWPFGCPHAGRADMRCITLEQL